MERSVIVPAEWDAEAHRLFLAGKTAEAVNAVAPSLKEHPRRAVQVAYYAYAAGDFRTSLQFLDRSLRQEPGRTDLLNSAAACCARLGLFGRTVELAERILAIDPSNAAACDAMAHAWGRLGNMEKAAEAGTKALLLKDAAACASPPRFRLPDEAEAVKAASGRKSVCAFSLFGSNPRYLRGALQNVLAGQELLPGWTMRFYADATAPEDFLSLLRSLGAETVECPADEPAGMKLCRRFRIASDASVGRFLVRDCDSVFSLREAVCIGEWTESGRLFHVIRDWYTHTDLMLAGLWGGIGGAVPSMQELLEGFFASCRTVTPNVDQLFLGQAVWPAAKQSCLIHDRHFGAFSPKRPPMRFFRYESDHIGADRSVLDAEWQKKLLAPWEKACPCLRLPE